MNTPQQFFPFDATLQSYDAIMVAYLQDLLDTLGHPMWVASSVTLLAVTNNAIGVSYQVNGSPICYGLELRLLPDGIDAIFHTPSRINLAHHGMALQHILLDALQDYLPQLAPLQAPKVWQANHQTPSLQAAAYQ